MLIASEVTKVPETGGDIGKVTEFEIDSGSLQGQTLRLVYGDHSKEMGIITSYHKKAAENAANENQKNMQLAYAKSFEEGSLEAFKDSQRYWIRDKGPMVESNIGFVETYRDPHGVRGEWEGILYPSLVSALRVLTHPFRICRDSQFRTNPSLWRSC